MTQNDEFERLLSDLEVRLERLRSLYEQYFLGIEKLEPTVPRKDVDRRFWDLRKVRIRNTALRFRLQTLVQRYNTLQQYWIRTCRQIEAGTYSRHVRRATRLAESAAQPEAPLPAADKGAEGAAPRLYDLGQMLSDDLAEDEGLAGGIDGALGLEARPPRLRAPRHEVASEPLSGDRMAALHGELSRARAQLQQGGVSQESVEKRLRTAEAELRNKHPGKTLDFRVEVSDGKAVIKPFFR